ncbi:macrolide transporter subunit MacA [Jeongeupia sp. USM3]|uniref:macrolide transporter subunit MacA n=1 Tax=Jeongeupia sp. USM3 TaxID=1906741 RepID=UPI00089DDF6D|nr:macrolide transporter subunit MacA [Jeongeupia sp. USM3]AOY01736.1 efflux transporter periplasmic adaptor subunit [Jeongeupia sp. USM3]
MKKRPLRWLIAIALLIPIVWLIGHFLFPAAKPNYLTAPVARMDLEESVLASGTLKPVKQVSIGAQVNGQLKSLKVKLGDRVSKGQLLAEIDPVLQQNELKKAEAGLARAEADRRAKAAQLVQFELALKRQKTMLASDASSRADLETAQAQVDSTRAELVALAAQIRQATVDVDTAKANLGYTRISAPMDGEIISVVTQEGQTVVSAQSAPTLLIMANLDTMTVKAQVSEADVVRVKPGQQVYFTILGAPGKRFYGTLRAIEPAPESISADSTATAATTTTAVYYNGLFDVPNPNHVLKTSMTAQVSIVQGEAKQVLALPVAALGKQEKDGRYAVRVLENDQPQERKVRIGLNDNVNAQVIDGLKEGDKVIVGDPAQLAADKPSEPIF